MRYLPPYSAHWSRRMSAFLLFQKMGRGGFFHKPRRGHLSRDLPIWPPFPAARSPEVWSPAQQDLFRVASRADPVREPGWPGGKKRESAGERCCSGARYQPPQGGLASNFVSHVSLHPISALGPGKSLSNWYVSRIVLTTHAPAPCIASCTRPASATKFSAMQSPRGQSK